MRRSQLAGVGIGLRRPFHETILETKRTVDWLEIVAENFMALGGRPRRVLDQCAERWPIVAHGVALSVGGPDPMGDYLDTLRPLLDRLNAPFFTEHLCYASLGGHQTFDLLPLPFHREAVRHVARRVREVERRLARPVALENITYYAVMPGSDMSEPALLRAVLEEADCGLLLDLNNLYVNAINNGHDPLALLHLLPLERVRQVHLAGFTREEGLLLDTHSRKVSEAVWSLYRATLMETGPVPTLIEWDQAIPSLDAVLDETDRARAIQREVSTPRAVAV
jgi:uncharacterized protein (UPF0276 family)